MKIVCAVALLALIAVASAQSVSRENLFPSTPFSVSGVDAGTISVGGVDAVCTFAGQTQTCDPVTLEFSGYVDVLSTSAGVVERINSVYYSTAGCASNQRLAADGATCEECPTGAICYGDQRIRAAPGYWVESELTRRAPEECENACLCPGYNAMVDADAVSPCFAFCGGERCENCPGNINTGNNNCTYDLIADNRPIYVIPIITVSIIIVIAIALLIVGCYLSSFGKDDDGTTTISHKTYIRRETARIAEDLKRRQEEEEEERKRRGEASSSDASSSADSSDASSDASSASSSADSSDASSSVESSDASSSADSSDESSSA